MAQSIVLAQIEQAIQQLSDEERLLLIERLAQGLRRRARDDQPEVRAALAQMAADPEMQRELTQIAEEFAVTEMDGLERS
jgi:hypothetical protein